MCPKTRYKIYVQLITPDKVMVQKNKKVGDFLKSGHARVSPGLQNLDLQEDRLKKFGCEKVFTDPMSGAKSNRPGLETAIEFVRSGDILVVW